MVDKDSVVGAVLGRVLNFSGLFESLSVPGCFSGGFSDSLSTPSAGVRRGMKL